MGAKADDKRRLGDLQKPMRIHTQRPALQRRLAALGLLSMTQAMMACLSPASAQNAAATAPRPSNTPTGLFGFMDDSTVIAKGAINPKYTFNPSTGGGSQTWQQKLTLNYGVSERFEAGVAITYTPTFKTAPNADTRALMFNVPLQYVFVQRMQNGTGFALVSNFGIGRETIAQQPNQTQWTIDNHLVLDHDFDGRYFIGTNLGYTANDSFNADVKSPSGTVYWQIGGTMKVNSHLYWGVQAQLSQQLNNYFSDPEGWAGFIGTSISVPINARFTFAASYMRQIIGGINGTPSARLNTQDFSQNMGRAVLSFTF